MSSARGRNPIGVSRAFASYVRERVSQGEAEIVPGGGRVLLVLADSKIVYGTLLKVEPEALVLRQKIAGGTVTVTIEKSRIHDFQVEVK